MAVFVDTTVWIAYFSGDLTRETDHLDRLLGVEEVVTGDLVVAEVLAGIADDAGSATVRDALTRFDVLQLGGWEAALAAAGNARHLRDSREGVAPDLVDGLIAACCLRRGFTLLHADPAFAPFEERLGLRSELPRRLPHSAS